MGLCTAIRSLTTAARLELQEITIPTDAHAQEERAMAPVAPLARVLGNLVLPAMEQAQQ